MSLSLDSVLVIGVLALFGVGLYALLIVRNLIKIVVALQIMAKAVILAMVVAGRASGQPALGQSLAATVIVADTALAIIGLGIATQVRRRTGTLDLRALARLRG